MKVLRTILALLFFTRLSMGFCIEKYEERDLNVLGRYIPGSDMEYKGNKPKVVAIFICLYEQFILFLFSESSEAFFPRSTSSSVKDPAVSNSYSSY